MTLTKDSEKLRWIQSKPVEIRETPAKSYNILVFVMPEIENIEEASDEEFLALPFSSGAFSFLNDPQEDIYSENDGTEIK